MYKRKHLITNHVCKNEKEQRRNEISICFKHFQEYPNRGALPLQ